MHQHMSKYSDISVKSGEIHRIHISDEDAARLAELFSAFSDPSRLRIISSLTQGELNVSAIADAAQLSESATSHHLRGLRQIRLVRARKQGRQVYYSLDDEHVKELFQLGLDHVMHG